MPVPLAASAEAVPALVYNHHYLTDDKIISLGASDWYHSRDRWSSLDRRKAQLTGAGMYADGDGVKSFRQGRRFQVASSTARHDDRSPVMCGDHGLAHP